MNLAQQICDALCKGFVVREIPIGLAIASPFDWFTGEKMIFYARIRGPQLRFEDNGSTIFELEGAGVDLSSSTRATSLQELCDEAGVVWDDDESMFYTNWFDPEEVGLKAIKFMGFMLRVQDLLMTIRSRVSSTFREDLIAAVQQRFSPEEAEVEVNAAPIERLSYYVVDVVVRHKSGKTAAIFPATTEERSLQAVLFAKELELKHVDNVVPFLVFEHLGGTKISKDTQTKAVNSELQIGVWEGGGDDVVEKIARHVAAA